VTPSSDEQVGGLDAAMNDALAVRGIESVGDLDANVQELLQLDWATPDGVLQGHSIEVLHGDERTTVVLADFVDGADIGVVQARGSTCLAAKTF
jgi:hypothetical protein